MNSVLARANTIFAFTLTVMAALTFACFLTTAFFDHKSDIGRLHTVKALVRNARDYSSKRDRSDLGIISVDLTAVLTHLFNWNVKQLFLYLTAEYETADHDFNQVVLWDKIILRGENANLNYNSMNTKYYFWDDGHGLKGNKNVTLTLSWNVIPNAGLLPLVRADQVHSFKFEDSYASSRF